MSSSWPKFASQCKSRLSAIARSCFLGREHWREKVLGAELSLEKADAIAWHWKKQFELLERENRRLHARILELEAAQGKPQPMQLPLGRVPRGQQYGDGMISVCVNLARRIGLRPAVRALEVVFEWLGVRVQIPRFQSVRLWMQRIGLDRMRAAKKKKGGVWLVDHTNQIGQEKVLTVARVRADRWRPGMPLRHQDIEIIALEPGRYWKRADVARTYQTTAERYGVPRAIESDGAVELREPAEILGKRRKRPLVIRDLKHFLANKFEALLKQDPRYEAFTRKLGGTRSILQQTELAHFIPPGFKTKARFMNMKPILDWAEAVLWQLRHPHSKSRSGISSVRLTEKFGWLQDFAPQLRQWNECQQVISKMLTFINQQGVFRGVETELKKRVARIARCSTSQQLLDHATKLLRGYARKLRPTERLPMSTEILESTFGRYKQLEQQHSKGGFTSLLLTFPTLLRPTNPQEVSRSFARVKTKHVKEWVREKLPITMPAKRQLLFREPRRDTKQKRTNRATTIPIAA